MKKKLPFRSWYYFRMGWYTYFAFIFAGINTMVVTYYLAIENASFLKEIFPSFTIYLVFMTAIGVPLLTLVGYIHYKKSHAFSSEADIAVEANPYYYKVPPGYWREVLIPMFDTMMDLLIKSIKDDKLSKEESERLSKLKKQLDILKKGGTVGAPTKFLKE